MSTVRYFNPDQSQANRARRTEGAVLDYPAARTLAAANSMELIQYAPAHYGLHSIQYGWLINLYPSGDRPCVEPHGEGPRLRPFPLEWTLLDVVRTAIGVEASG